MFIGRIESRDVDLTLFIVEVYLRTFYVVLNAPKTGVNKRNWLLWDFNSVENNNYEICIECLCGAFVNDAVCR